MSTDLEKRHLQGRVKSIRSETVEFEKEGGQFNEKPWLIQTESFDPEGRLSETSFHNTQHPEFSSRQTFDYDSTGRLAEESSCSEGRGVTSNTQCLYDSQNRPVRRVSLDGDGKATGKSDVLYDADGNKLEESSYDAGIQNFRLHDLRHTTASWLRMTGADTHTVGLLLGHKDPRMAARYQHLSPAYLSAAVSGLDTVFGPVCHQSVTNQKLLESKTVVSD